MSAANARVSVAGFGASTSTRMEVDTPQRRVSSFLGKLSNETKTSKCTLRLTLARKKNERVKKIQQRRKQQQRIKKMLKELETTEAEIQLLDEDITHLVSVEEDATDGEDDV